jgi:HSP20 family protein
MFNVDEAIREVSTVYQALTGGTLQPGKSELPPEEDPQRFVQARYELFRRMCQGFQGTAPQAAAWAPPADVVETERDVRIELDVAGVARSDVAVTLDDNVIWIRGRRGRSDGGQLRHAERVQGSFQRAFALPPRAKRERIEAAFHDGVLTISVPLEGPPAGSEVPVAVK